MPSSPSSLPPPQAVPALISTECQASACETTSPPLWLDLGQALAIAVLLVSALFLIAGFLILPAAPLS